MSQNKREKTSDHPEKRKIVGSNDWLYYRMNAKERELPTALLFARFAHADSQLRSRRLKIGVFSFAPITNRHEQRRATFRHFSQSI